MPIYKDWQANTAQHFCEIMASVLVGAISPLYINEFKIYNCCSLTSPLFGTNATLIQTSGSFCN